MPRAARPHVVCHMVPSIDGRIVTRGWALPPSILREYERTAATFDADAWIIGRISMEPYAGKARIPKRKAGAPKIPRTDFIARRDAGSYAIALDPSGKLRWESADLDGEHVIAVLTAKVSDDYLAFLREKGISYLIAGRVEVDLGRALATLRREFGIRRLLLEGGGKINGSFLRANLIDELSVLLAPLADGSVGTPTLFDVGDARSPVRHLRLRAVERRAGGMVWLRYDLKR